LASKKKEEKASSLLVHWILTVTKLFTIILLMSRITEGEPRGMGVEGPSIDYEQDRMSNRAVSGRETRRSIEAVFSELKGMIMQDRQPHRELGDDNAYLVALIHSDADDSEMHYMLGLTPKDPNPDHDITFDPKHPLPKAYIKRPKREPLFTPKKRWRFTR
jgi:hypothetical protein